MNPDQWRAIAVMTIYAIVYSIVLACLTVAIIKAADRWTR